MAAVGNSSLRDSLRRALARAIRQRESISVAAPRLALASIENAEAVTSPPGRGSDGSPIAGSVEGLGAGEAKRRALTEADAVRLVWQEVKDLQRSAELYGRVGRYEPAAQLRAQAAVLSAFVCEAG